MKKNKDYQSEITTLKATIQGIWSPLLPDLGNIFWRVFLPIQTKILNK